RRGAQTTRAAAGALRSTGRTRRQNRRPARTRRWAPIVGRTVANKRAYGVRSHRRRVVLLPGADAYDLIGEPGDVLGELVVEDHRTRSVPLEDLDDLRTGERGVQIEDVGAEPVDRNAGLDEPAVIAAQQRHAVAVGDTEPVQ